MNLNINRTGINPMGQTPVAPREETAPTAAPRGLFGSNLAITSVKGENADFEVSDEALRRDDDLGKLLDRVFDLPCPAMPTFEE